LRQNTVPNPAPRLETDRLILRPPLAEDFDAWAEFCADEEAARFIGGAQTRAGAWRVICVMTGAWTIRGYSMFSVLEKATGRWVGRVGPWKPETWPGIVRDCWGKGYAVEAAEAAIDWAFDVLGWDEVIHTIEPANQNSIKVAQKLGSRILRQAVLPPPLNVAVDCWGQSREEWRARRGR
jgi:RimJ/RimL family protein N-acetyltransferase